MFWRITRDHLAENPTESDAGEGSGEWYAATGKNLIKFKIYDDDGILYYSGE